MARALVLDFGGVITRTLFETHEASERALGLTPGALTWRGPFDPESDALWRDMQAERISERDYWLARTREVGHLVGEHWDRMETLVQRVRGADIEAVIRPEAVAAVHAAKAARHKLAILSNELDLFYGADIRQRWPMFTLFDAVVDATHTQILKPDARAYALCIERLGVQARDCVFVDDQRRNIDGARRAGLQAVHFDVKAVHFDVTQPARSYAEALALLGVDR
jgi:putative hydrolase of the HAD superfamily